MILVSSIEHLWYFLNKIQLAICIFWSVFGLLGSNELFVNILEKFCSKLWFNIGQNYRN